MTEKVSKKDWLKILSPAVLGAVLSVIGIIISFIGRAASGGWSFLIILTLAEVFAILLTLDFLIKRAYKDKILTIWLIELLILGLTYWVLGI